MRRRYLLVLTLIVLIAALSLVYYLTLSTPLLKYIEPQNQDNGTSTPSILPFKFPWETTQTTTNKSSGGGAGGGSGSGGSGSGGSGAGSSGGGKETNTPQLYYVLSADSSPESLNIFVNYYTNNEMISQTLIAPFNLEVDPNSYVCVLPASLTSKGILKWTLDGQDCQFFTCETSSYNRTETVYSDKGCLINMNTNHSLTLYYLPA